MEGPIPIELLQPEGPTWASVVATFCAEEHVTRFCCHLGSGSSDAELINHIQLRHDAGEVWISDNEVFTNG
eukprot:4990581-Amphidinium_carterae.1